MKILTLMILGCALYAEEDPEPKPPTHEQEIAAKDATIQRQQQFIQALQAKIAALVAYISADEQVRALQPPAKEQVKQ